MPCVSHLYSKGLVGHNKSRFSVHIFTTTTIYKTYAQQLLKDVLKMLSLKVSLA